MKLESPLDKLLRYFRTRIVTPYVTRKEMDICDLGCGINPALLKYLATITTAKLVGIDDLVADSSSSAIELRNGNLNNLQLPMHDAEFDLITMLAVLEHLVNYDEIISECFRGLKSKGKLLLTTPAPRSKPILELLADLRIISHAAIYDHKKYFTQAELVTLLQKHNFTEIRVWSVAGGLNTVASAVKP